ncbi:MAG TPA: S8 family serine peptidase, partial [Chthoniobacterales bacterium]
MSTIYNAVAPLNYDGAGLSVGVMSDSYDRAANPEAPTKAPADVASGDLPGSGNSVNPQPVVVLDDPVAPQSATDEGRAMCQIVHDVAPKARIGFASASVGEVGFANNMRALAGMPGFTKAAAIQQNFKGDVVCDDVSYIDEPMFSDGVVAQGAIDVVNFGATYASSAANNSSVNGYASVFRPVPNGSGLTSVTNTALAGTNINLAGVDPAVYAGGFHNFNPGAGQDVAQTINTSSDEFFVFQWNDPYDVSPPVIIGPPIFDADGTSAACSEMDFFPPPLTAGQAYVITEFATPQNMTEDFDAIVRVTDPNGHVLVDQDTGVDEVVTFFAPVSGQYKITVHPFAANPPVCTQGNYHIRVNNASGVARITQDFNVLLFDMSGNFLTGLTLNNIANNRPIEISPSLGLSNSGAQAQMVICRSNTTAPANAANQLKYLFFANGASGVGPDEYFSYLTPVTYGHSAAAGANSVAAYSPFRPNLPEDFTSPGPVVIYFDQNNNRLATPEVRQKPDIAACDGVNNTFFPFGPTPGLGDALNDPDTLPNFYGTSAASPHCAALGALVLQAHGGSHSLTPAQVKRIFQTTAWTHDLDSLAVSGSMLLANGGQITINVASDDSANSNTGANDKNSIRVSYIGPGRIATLSFNPNGGPADGNGSPTAGNTTGGKFDGFTPADFLDSTKYTYTPGMVWGTTFLFGDSTGLSAGDVVATRSNPAMPTPNQPTPMWTLNLTFPNNNFTNGKVLRFNNSRSQYKNSYSPTQLTIATYTADLLGQSVLIPEDPNGSSVGQGMTFGGTVVDGATVIPFNGRLTNNIGRGYAPQDGYGFINVEAAVTAPVPSLALVYSRKTHDVRGAFDLPLPAVGDPGVEPRDAGPNGNHTMVFKFTNVLTGVDTAQVTNGVATISSAGIGSDPHEYIVELTNVKDAQFVTVKLNGVHSGGNTDPVITGSMGVLAGDCNQDRRVNIADTNYAKSRSGQNTDSANFLADVDLDSRINIS